MGRRNGDSRFVHHTLQKLDVNAAATSLKMAMDGLDTDASSTVNPCFPHAVRLRGIAVHSACIAVNSAGAWTLRIRVNESGSDSVTFSVGMGATGSKDAGEPSTDLVLQAGDTYHVVVDGPSRNVAAARATLEWEVL